MGAVGAVVSTLASARGGGGGLVADVVGDGEAVAVAVAVLDGGVGSVPSRVTVVQLPKVPQLPPVRAAESRWTTSVVAVEAGARVRAPVDGRAAPRGWCTRGRRRASTI